MSSTEADLTLEQICSVLTARGFDWYSSTANSSEIFITTDGNVDAKCADAIYFLMRHKLYVSRQEYRSDINKTITVFKPKRE